MIANSELMRLKGSFYGWSNWWDLVYIVGRDIVLSTLVTLYNWVAQWMSPCVIIAAPGAVTAGSG